MNTQSEPFDLVNVLLLEDDPTSYEFVHTLIAGSYGIDFNLEWVTTLDDMFDHLQSHSADVLVMDFHIGDDCCVEIARQLVERGHNHLPIILFTDVTDRQIDLAAMEAGVTDFLIKQETTASIFERSLRYAIKQKKTEAMVRYQALHDALTGLANRTLLQEHLKRTLAETCRHTHYNALLFIDLDNFKSVNDTLGHAFGDQLLVEMANRLKTLCRKDDIVARFGGDEFVFLIGHLPKEEDKARRSVRSVSAKIHKALATPVLIDDHAVNVAGSIGITLFNSDAADYTELLKQSDIAMYSAKGAGKNQACFFLNDMQQALLRDVNLVNDLRDAAKKNELECYLQPIVHTHRNEVAAAEVLLRWHHPQLGDIPPMEFIACAEKYHLIAGIERWVIRQACEALAQNPNLSFVSINISARHFLRSDFAEVVQGIILNCRTAANRLVFELTESQLIEDITSARTKMQELAELGVRFALDDFGTGYSSVYLLKNLPFDMVKIDKSFIDDIHACRSSESLVSAIIAMGQALGLEVIAEGVENTTQQSMLTLGRCTYLQGFLFAEPMALEAFNQWVTDQSFMPADPAYLAATPLSRQ